LHNEMVSADGGDPRSILDTLAQLRYDTFAISGEGIGPESILSKPITRIVAKRAES